jgi:hypothetical protein
MRTIKISPGKSKRIKKQSSCDVNALLSGFSFCLGFHCRFRALKWHHYLQETLTKRVFHCLLCLISLSLATDRYFLLSVSLTNVCSFLCRCVSHRLFLIKTQYKRNLLSSLIPDLFSLFVGVMLNVRYFSICLNRSQHSE